MKRTILNTLGLCAALALSVSLAVAQTNNSKAAKGKPPEGKLVKASEVLEAKLFNQNGDHIGQINDFVLDENAGNVTHGVLAMGDWLGVGDKVTAVPWKYIQQSKSDSPGYVLNVDKAKLKGAPSYDRNVAWDENERWYCDTNSSFDMPTKQGVKLVRASKVMGAELYNQQGEDIGEIQNLLMHPNSGKVAYGVCEVDTYGIGGKRTIVPFTLIRQSKGDTVGFAVNVDKRKLTGAKYFGENDWPDYNNEGWNNTLYGYYGAEPYWTDSGAY